MSYPEPVTLLFGRVDAVKWKFQLMQNRITEGLIRVLSVAVSGHALYVLAGWVFWGEALPLPGLSEGLRMLGTTAICFALLGVVLICQDVRSTLDRILFTVGVFWVLFTASVRLFLMAVAPNINLDHLLALGGDGHHMTVGTSLGLVLVALSIVLNTYGQKGWSLAGRVISRFNTIVVVSAFYFVMTGQRPILMAWVFEDMPLMTYISFVMICITVCLSLSQPGYGSRRDRLA